MRRWKSREDSDKLMVLGSRLTVGQRPLKPLIGVRFPAPQPKFCYNLLPQNTMDKINVLLVSGSINEKSYTRSLSDLVVKTLNREGVSVFHWNLQEKPLPIMVPELRKDISNNPDTNTREFGKLATDCDAFALASPIYHNSYSGVLKNAIDHLRNPHFTYKAVGLISHGGHRSTQAVDHLRIVGRAVGSIVIPTTVCTSEDDFDGYKIVNNDILERVQRFCEELVLFAKTMRPLRRDKIAKDK